jgi:hypothetical protein
MRAIKGKYSENKTNPEFIPFGENSYKKYFRSDTIFFSDRVYPERKMGYHPA